MNDPFNLAQEVLNYSKTLTERFEQKGFTHGSLKPYQLLLAIILNEVRLLLDAVILLCRNKHDAAAGMVIRAFFEMYVTVKYLDRNREHVMRYIEFGSYLKAKKVEDMEKHGEKPITDDEKRKKIFGEYDQVQKMHNFERRKWYPLGLTFEGLCKEIDAGKSYDLLYRYLSDFIHFNVMSLRKHRLDESDKTVSFEVDRSEGHEHLHVAADMTLIIYGLFDKEFGTGCEKDLLEMLGRLREETPSVSA